MSSPARVLVLSAEPEDTAQTVVELRHMGYHVPDPVAPFDPASSSAALSRHQLIVLDLRVGSVLAGLHAAEQIRSAADIPILLLVSDIDADEQTFITGAHSFELLMRPFAPAALRVAAELALARHAARNQHRSEADRYRDLVENSYDLICTHDAQGKLLSVNTAAEKALGYSREAWIGRSLQDLLVPETKPLFAEYLDEILRNGSAHGVMRMRAANGDVREWEYHNSERQLEDGTRIIRGLAHDITEQLKAARELRASEQRFRALFEQAAVGVAYINTQSGGLLAVNEKCAQILGYAREELLAVSFASLIRPEDIPRYDQLMAQLAQGEVSEFVAELRLLCKDGADIWIALSVSPLSRDGSHSSRHMAVVQDISQRKAAETQRGILEAQLRQAQKMEAIGTLAGGIAHDFNNLLTTMVGNVELARLDVESDHSVVASLDAIAAAARRATDLVRQILAFSRKQPSQRTVIALAPVIADSARLLRATLPAAIEIKLHLEESAPPVNADATQVHQVVMNLCTNAWQAITKGKGCIDITLDAVEVTPSARVREGAPAGRYARIRVNDTGEGMDSHTLERIFEPFFTTKPAGRGSGLGLSVAHGIVRDHGGAISARSREGEGATFEVLLPAAVAGVNAQSSSEPLDLLPLFGHGRVLYIDDEKTLTLAVARLLESLGYHATTCNSGAEALELVRASPHAFDAVLTDLSMPGLSGTDVARELMRIRPGLPVVLTSGYAERAGENLAALGIRLRLDKPFDRRTLSEALNQVMEQSIKAAG